MNKALLQVLSRRVACLALVVCAEAAWAGSTMYVNGKSGSWDDGANYTGGVAPGANDMFWYNSYRFSPKVDHPMTLSLDGKTHYLRRFYMDMEGSAAAATDPCPLTILGPGTLNISAQSENYNQIAYGREVTFDHINFVITNHLGVSSKGGGLMPSGKVTVKGGRVEAVDNGAYISVSGDHGALVIEDGAEVKTRYLTISDTGTVDLRGGSLSFTSFDGNNYNVKTPNLHIGANSRFLSLNTTARYLTKGIFPAGTNSLVVVNAPEYSAVQPPLEAGEKIAWRGTLAVTNSVLSKDTSPQCMFTNSVCIYGRGRFMACYPRFASDVVSDVDLARFDIGERLGSSVYVNPATVNFYSTTLGRFQGNSGATTVGFSTPNIHLNFYGRTVFDFTNLNDPSATVTHTDSAQTFRLKERSSLCLCGKGVYGQALDEMPTRFEAYEIGEGMAVTQQSSDRSVGASLRVRDFKMGANASYRSGQYNQEIEAFGDVSIDPTASIVHTSYNSSNHGCWPAFRSLEAEPPTKNLTLTTMPANYSLRWVAGSAFYADDVDITSGLTQSYGYWLDAGPDCLFSTADNWGNKKLYKDGTVNMTLSGKQHTIVTNDVEDVAVKSLIFGMEQQGYAATAPFVVRGKSIRVTNTDTPVFGSTTFSKLPAVFTHSPFPQTMEARIDSNEDVLHVATVTDSDRRGALYFKGGIGAPNARFVPSGSVVLDGMVTVRDFNPTNAVKGYVTRHTSPYGKRNWTEVMLKPGCAMTVSAQTSANCSDVILAIMTNATMTVNGSWMWNATNTEHIVRGALDLNGTVGGDAVQGYFGCGLLKVKTTDGTAGGKLQVGEGLTLMPTAANWGSMPLEVLEDATITNALDTWTYAASGLSISRPGHTLTVAGSGTTVLAAPVSGHDVVLRKEGAGTLVLAAASTGLTNSTVEVTEGALGCTADQSLGALRLAPGTGLLVDFADGAAIDVAGDVCVDGVELRSAGGNADGWKDVLRVPAGAAITGTLLTNDRLRTKYVTAVDGSTTLQAKIRKGLTLIVR